MSDHTLPIQAPKSLAQLPYSSPRSIPTSQSYDRTSPMPRSLLLQSDPLDLANGLSEEWYEQGLETSVSQYELVPSTEQRSVVSRRSRDKRRSAISLRPMQSEQSLCSQPLSDVDEHDACTSRPIICQMSDSRATAAPTHSREIQEGNRLTILRAPTKIVHRAQLVSNFVDSYLSFDKLARYFNDELANLPAVDFASATLQAATDTICFAGLGAAHGDERLIVEARIRFGCALKLLSTELRERPQKSRFRQIITSITLLRMCELFDCLSYQGASILADGWNWHLEATQDYMRECGPEGLLQNDYDWLLFRNIRHYSFYADILHRRPSMFAEPRWLAMTTARASRDPGVALYNLRAQLPGIATKVRSACLLWSRHPEGSPQILQDFESLQNDIRWLRRSLASWMEHSGEMISSDRMLDLSATSKGKTPPSRTPEFNLLRASFHFTSAEKAAQTTSCWMLCVTVNDLHANLLKSRPTSASDLPSTLAEIKQDSYVCATNLARCVDWCSQEDVAQVSTVGDFHLRIVESHFRTYGHVSEVEWCGAMRELMATRAQRFVVADHTSICQKIMIQQVGILRDE